MADCKLGDKNTDKNPSLRVVIYTDATGIGGAELSLGHLVGNLSRTIALTVVGVSQQVVRAIAAQHPAASQVVLPDRGIQSLASHLKTFHQLKPDIVHVNLCTPWASAVGLLAALTLPDSRVVRVDQLPLRTTDAITLWRTRLICLRVDAHVAVGQVSAKQMEDFYALGRHTVLSIPNGVPNVVQDVVEGAIPFIPRKDRQLIIGSVGRLDAMKGHDVLLRAIAQVTDLQVVIVGEGDQRQALEQLVANLGISDRVNLWGWVDNPRAYLSAFDIVAMPSRSEGFPLAIVEAMLAARPIVATRVGSVAEAVIDNETGLLVEKDDVNGLALAIQRLVNDPVLRDRLGKRAQEVAIAHFTVEQMTKRYEQIWQNVLSVPQSPRFRVPRPRD